MSNEQNFTIDSTDHYFVSNSAYILTGTHLKYLLGVINSSTLDFAFSLIASQVRGETRRYFKQYVELLPVIAPESQQTRQVITAAQPESSSRTDTLYNLITDSVDVVLDLKKNGRDASEWEAFIDRLVYRLYDLSDEEIAIVENLKA